MRPASSGHPASKTSSSKSSRSVAALDGTEASQPTRPEAPPQSPGLSATSTIDGSDEEGSSSSFVLPSLPAPELPERARELLEGPTSPPAQLETDESGQYVTASWGSPYPHAQSHHLRRQSFSSEASDSSLPAHQLHITTPFLRTAPLDSHDQEDEFEPPPSTISESAAVLVNRVRRPVRGITEDWIRTHTTNDPDLEHRHWFSEGEDSEHSSLSGSVSSGEAGWFQETDPRTPRASLSLVGGSRGARRVSPGHLPRRSSNETLKQAILNRREASISAPPPTMDNLSIDTGAAAHDAASVHTLESNVSDPTSKVETPTKTTINGSVLGPLGDVHIPTTPSKPTKSAPAQTPRLKKKVPWRGKNIMVHLPRDDERGQPGKSVMPLTAANVANMLSSWEELGYDISGFDLPGPPGFSADLDPLEGYSQSRNQWPNLDDVAHDRAQRQFKVTLPDLNAWKDYVNELTEAKLRALGVVLDEPAPPPSLSPAPSNMSRMASAHQYPPLPFSPPVPSSSAASIGPQGFPFPSAFHGSATQSPAIPSVPSPVSYNPPLPPGPSKFNPRASISISPNELPFHFSGQPSPHGWSPQSLLLQQQLARSGSPSMLNFANSPLSPDGVSSPLGFHQRHQSLQYPMLPHQQLYRQDSARASPRLQELREVDEETQSNPYEDKSPSKTPEPAHFVRHNASDSLQREIDDAEYHLEEQFREQLEHEDYSPHNGPDKVEAVQLPEATEAQLSSHNRGPSVHFSGLGPDSAEGPVLHHPQPHSRGHSLSQKPFLDNDDLRDSTDEGSSHKPQALDTQAAQDAAEIETNPSNLGTPNPSFDLVNKLHQREESITSNPWADAEPLNGSKVSSRRPSHGSKPSFSKLNAAATEFKFNPKSNFTPGQFSFGSSTAPQPTASGSGPVAFQASNPGSNAPTSATSSHFSLPPNSSLKPPVSAAASIFSPKANQFNFGGENDFNFSGFGPKFNPDAPTFQPLNSFTPSVPAAHGAKPSIFGPIKLDLSEATKPAKKSKAVPIVRPPSRGSPTPSAAAPAQGDESATGDDLDGEGRLADKGRRSKKFRDDADGGDDVPRFAEPTPEPEPLAPPEKVEKPLDKAEEAADIKSAEAVEDDEAAAIGDTTLASTILSESTDGRLQSESNDTKATTSPSATSPDHEKTSWPAFEFRNDSDMKSFNDARPFGEVEPAFEKTHRQSLSATAKPFVPTAFNFGAPNSAETTFDPVFKSQPAPMLEPEESEDDRAASPTPGPEPRPIVEAKPEADAQTVSTGLGASRFASPPPQRGLAASRFASPPKAAGLAASRFAAPQTPVSETPVSEVEAMGVIDNDELDTAEPTELQSFDDSLQHPVSPPSMTTEDPIKKTEHELTFEEIDAVMQHLDEDPSRGVNRTGVESSQWAEPSPLRTVPLAAVTDSSPLRLPPQSKFRSDAPNPSLQQYRALPQEPAPQVSTELEDPFLDPPHSAISQNFSVDGPVRQLNAGATPGSEWDDAFSPGEQAKLEERVQYFDGRVNDVVGNLLASRLDPLEKTLASIQHVLASMSRSTPSSRRDRRSVSAEIQDSDADDEDDEVPVARRSMSPKRDKRMEQVRFAVMDALNQHHASRALQQAVADPIEEEPAVEGKSILQALEEMREQFGQSLHLDFRGEDLRNVVEEAVASRMPPTPVPQPIVKDDEEATQRMAEMQTKIADLEQRLRSEQDKVSFEQERVRLEQEKTRSEQEKLQAEQEKVGSEIAQRREAEDRVSETRRQLDQAETKIEVEIMNRSVYDQRVHDLEERLRAQEDKVESEIEGRRQAEDRLSETQRLLRISSEEEDRLRAVLEERDQKVKAVEQNAGKTTMRLSLLEAAQSNGNKTQADLTNRLNAVDEELRGARQEAQHWRSEADHARESGRRQGEDLMQSVNENKHLRKVIDTLGTQLEENERIRDTWRAKFGSLQDDMAHAAHEITEENSRRTKREESLVARQEVLEARLQAESRTRERLETELERLEGNERAGMRAVNECKRLEGLLVELRNDNHNLHQSCLRLEREHRETREAGASELQRTRDSVQEDLESARGQVDATRAELEAEVNKARIEADAVRAELEEEISRGRAQLDQVKLDADTAKAHHDMMLEAAQTTKHSELQELVRKHQDTMEDLQAQHERQINNTAEDAQRAEQNLLERLSLSSSKTEHLEDRIAHLEEKLQIAQEAGRAAAQAAASAVRSPLAVESAGPPVVANAAAASRAMQLPEKISPQALRESIMVLQEQLQAREQHIEELEQTVAELDPEAPTKISKRDDEITWLRELLAVRHGDLQDIIAALSADDFNRETVKDAAIRLKANLQMEEQERERAMSGGSAINVPSIAATLNAASPRVAQAVGPLAAAWGNWRKTNQPIFGTRQPSPAVRRNATPSRSSSGPAARNKSVSGLMTPPASGLRDMPPVEEKPQPTAFGNTGRRYTSEQFANRSRGPSLTSRQAEKLPAVASTPPRGPSSSELGSPVTPPMMRSGGYDADANSIEDFDDAGFFDD